jgi:hypothetical protein
MRAYVATFTAVALLVVAGASSSAPPVDRPHVDDRRDEKGHALACTGFPCNVSPYEGKLPANFDLAKMQKLGCEAPFNHLGGLKAGQTSWVGFSCPEHVRAQFPNALPHEFSDACLPKRHGRVYVPVFEGTCHVSPFPNEGPIAEKARALGCGPLHMYHTGNGSGLLGGIGSYCPDTKAVREAAPCVGYAGPYCDGCLEVPAGQIFHMWTLQSGPSCPSGCPSGHTAPGI